MEDRGCHRNVRTILLWMARNPWLRRRVPRLGFVRRAVRRFMPGEDAADAFDAAARLAGSGQGILFTRLGENLTAIAEADEVAAHYDALLDREASLPRPPELSVKPTQLGLDIDTEACFRHLDALAARAADAGTWLWLDMEGSAYVDATLGLYQRLRAAHPNVGICLQAYLKRTPKDLRDLLPLVPAVRLVKGAYDEPAAIAHRRRPDVDAAYQALALVLAEAARDGRARCALGTHDSGLIERIASFAAAAGVAHASLEVHMLYGIRARELVRLHAAGFPAFTLVAYGAFWYPWYMRRLAERPANVLFALRQILP
jgi:proline dehydrogenase